MLPEDSIDPLKLSKTDKYAKIEDIEKIEKTVTTPEKVPEKVVEIPVDEPATPPLVNLLNPEVPEARTPEMVRTLTPELPKVSKSAEKLNKKVELVKTRSPSPRRPLKMMNICSFLSDIETGGFSKVKGSSFGDLSPLRFDDEAEMKEDFEYKMHW